MRRGYPEAVIAALVVHLLCVTSALPFGRTMQEAAFRAASRHSGAFEKAASTLHDYGIAKQAPDAAAAVAAGALGPMPSADLYDITEEDERRGRHQAVLHHSLHPPFIGTSIADEGAMQFWSIGGSTVVAQRYVRFTPADVGRFGFMENTYRNEVQSWEAYIGALVHSPTSQGADGMAFWYRDESLSSGGLDAGPLLGASANFRGLGVLLDSHDNNRAGDGQRVQVVYNPPFRTASAGRPQYAQRTFDPSNDFELKAEDVPQKNADDDEDDEVPSFGGRTTNEGTQPWPDPNKPSAYGCTFDFRSYAAAGMIQLRIAYEHKEKTLAVFVARSGGAEKPCVQLRGIELPTGNRFGFSAATGGLTDNHDLLYFHLSPRSSLTEDEVIDREIQDLRSKIDAAHGHGYEHRKEALDRLYWSAEPDSPDGHEQKEALRKRIDALAPSLDAKEEAKRQADQQRLTQLMDERDRALDRKRAELVADAKRNRKPLPPVVRPPESEMRPAASHTHHGEAPGDDRGSTDDSNVPENEKKFWAEAEEKFGKRDAAAKPPAAGVSTQQQQPNEERVHPAKKKEELPVVADQNSDKQSRQQPGESANDDMPATAPSSSPEPNTGGHRPRTDAEESEVRTRHEHARNVHRAMRDRREARERAAQERSQQQQQQS